MKKWALILLMLLLTLPGYALITIEKKPGTGTLSGHLDDINANDMELDGKIEGKVSDDAFTADWGEVTDVAPSQAALYNYLVNFDADGDGLFSDEAWFPSIFDPAAPGEIGGTTPAAGTFTDLNAGTLTLTPTDGENRLTFPENTTRTPASGAEEIYNEGGVMKYSENGVEKNFVTIDDTAGDGDTTVTLSADKIVELIMAGGSGVPDGTSANDILAWDGDSWEPIALEDHPAFSSLLTAFNNAGLNAFTFTPSVTYPRWANTSPVTISFDVTDTSTTYAVADVNYQRNGTGGFVVGMTHGSGDTWTANVTISTDGAHTVQLEATDDKAGTPNTGQSTVYTINFDATSPIVGTVTPDPTTHDGTGTAIAVTVASITETNEATRQYQIYDVTSGSVEEAYQSFTGLTINETLPSDQHTYRFDIRVTDLAGNTGTASSSNIVYSAGSCAYSAPGGAIETFEPTGYDLTWTESVPTGATVDENYTSSPIDGSQSLQIIGGTSASAYATTTMTNASELWGHFLYKTTDITPAAAYAIAYFRQSSTTICQVELRADGHIRLYHGSATLTESSLTLADNTAYHILFRYVKGTGTDGVYQLWVWEKGASKPGTPTLSGTNGTGTLDANTYRLNQYNSNTGLYDQVLYSTSEPTICD